METRHLNIIPPSKGAVIDLSAVDFEPGVPFQVIVGGAGTLFVDFWEETLEESEVPTFSPVTGGVEMAVVAGQFVQVLLKKVYKTSGATKLIAVR